MAIIMKYHAIILSHEFSPVLYWRFYHRDRIVLQVVVDLDTADPKVLFWTLMNRLLEIGMK